MRSFAEVSSAEVGPRAEPRPPPARPLRIGPLVVDPPVVLAPMAGVTNAPFRAICRAYGAGLYVSEMVTARGLVEGHDRSLGLVRFGLDESPRSVQLYGSDPATMAAAVHHLVDEVGAEHVDLNFGCPVRKVTRHGGGAALPLKRRLLASVIEAAVGAAGTVPVTVKFRIGVDHRHTTFLDTGRIAEESGCAAVALHARTAAQLYSGRADWEAIAELKAHVRSIPVLGNGDVWVAEDALAMMASTGCDGVVVGRGCLGRPWLFRDLAAALAGRGVLDASAPRLGDVAATMRAHARQLVAWSAATGGVEAGAADPDHVGVRDFRKHTGWYLHGYPVGPDVRRRLHQVSTLRDLDRLLDELDPTLELPPEAVGLPRGHQHGPRPVTLPAGFLDDPDDPSPLAGADDHDIAAASGG